MKKLIKSLYALWLLFNLRCNKVTLLKHLVSGVVKGKGFLNLSYFLLYSGYPDKASRAIEIDLILSKNINEAKIYHYFACLLLSSPKKLSHKAYLNKILKYTTRKLPYVNDYKAQLADTNPNKKLKIGYICHFFSNNISQAFLWKWVLNHNKEQFDIYCLSDDKKAGCIPNELKEWEEFKNKVNFIDTSDLDADQFVDFIRNNNFDIVLELNGHCGASRYAEINRRVAPIQISYYNISGPSGVRGLDYIFYTGTSTNIKPIENFYTEKFFKIPSDATPMIPNDYYPDICSPAFQKNGYITFASFGAIHKVHIDHFKLWCEILKKVPNSRFLLKASTLDDPNLRKVWEDHFVKNGIELERVRIEGFETHKEMLKKYHDVDIALDTYPHGAGTTTIDSLYMGVPVIALDGERLCSQHGNMIIGDRFGRHELIAKSEQEYVGKAVALANDLDRLSSYRRSLRRDYLKSSNSDVSVFVKALEDSYRVVWKDYIRSVSQKSF